jgi:hypothetical protein
MPTIPRREDALIRMFISAFEEGAWADATLDWCDQRQDGAVEVVAERRDGKRLAVEHTLVEFFPGEREEFERFRRAVLPIEQDTRLVTANRIVGVDIPRDFLPKGTNWSRIASAFSDWLAHNIQTFADGESEHACASCRAVGAKDATVHVNVQTVSDWSGSVMIRRYGPVDIAASVAKALSSKLPKLLNADAHQRVLMLERNQFRLDERVVMHCVQEWLALHPPSKALDVWMVETVFYDGFVGEGWRDYAEFKRYGKGVVVESMAFFKGTLRTVTKNGVPTVIAPMRAGE